MKTKATTAVLILLVLGAVKLQARSSNIVWMVDYVISSNTNVLLSTDAAATATALDAVASRYGMTKLDPDRDDVVRIYTASPEILIALDATIENNQILVHTVPMTPRLAKTSKHEEFFADLEATLRAAFGTRFRKKEEPQQSLPPVSGTRGTPAAYAPVAPRIPER